jgi:hypothetical protein
VLFQGGAFDPLAQNAALAQDRPQAQGGALRH